MTNETQAMVKALDEDINIYVLVNEEQADELLDATLNTYKDLNTHIKVSYVDPAVNPKFFTQYTSDSVTYNSIIVEGSRRSKVIDYSSIYESEIDYSTYTSAVTGYDGEGQLTSAISYVTTDDMPKIYMLEGHGEVSFDVSFLSAIEKENVDYEIINLLNYDKIPDDAMCVVINAPSEDLSDEDTKKMLDYMNEGGNVLLISSYTGRELVNFNSLLDFYGVSVSRGLIIEGNKNYYYGRNPFYLLPDIVYDDITASAYNSGSYVFVPEAQGLTVSEREDTEVTTLLSSSNESYVRDDISGSESYEKQENDMEGPFAIGVKCVKTLEDKSSAAVIYSSQYLFTEGTDSMVAGTNSKLFSGSLGSLVSHESSISIPVKSYEASYLILTENQIILLSLLTVIAIPFAFLISGFVIWFRRRKW